MRAHPILLSLALLAFAACSSTGSLTYTPTGAVAPGPAAAVSGVTATDVRGEKPNRFATVRGGYGNPVYVRDTARPVSEEVAAAFTKALQARGMLGQPGQAPYSIQLTLRQLEGNHYFRGAAYIDLDLVVSDRSGRTLYKDTVKDKREKFDFFGLSIAELEALVQGLLNATVDRMLDNPNLRAVLGGAAGRGAPSS